MNTVELEAGQVVASGRIGRDDREYCFQARRIQMSCQEFAGFAGSVASPWIIAGYDLCSRLVGSQAWQAERGPLHRTLAEALRALAEDLEFPDRMLIHPRAIQWRHEVREDAGTGDAAEDAEPDAPTS